ncbi:MAG TPA: pirin-like C-terminal cupin domain-containing protein, partial [Burkholderiaceae bacterium]|nr:pirin-like C-terminal cupin domain-containing protein [Burkholderiaceae bacterium]
IQGDAIPEFTTPGGVTVRAIAGASHGVAGAMRRDVTEPLYLDLHFAPGAAFRQALPAAHNAFVYVYRGALALGDAAVPAQRMAILKNEGDGAALQATGDAPARALLIAGRPLGEPIAQYGPFVMNTQQQIFEAVEDFRAGRFTG